jgi:hypothetical protein
MVTSRNKEEMPQVCDMYIAGKYMIPDLMTFKDKLGLPLTVQMYWKNKVSYPSN